MSTSGSKSFTFDTWRDAVRPFLAAGAKAEELSWGELSVSNWLERNSPILEGSTPRHVRGRVALPRIVMSLLENLACIRDADRWILMYRLSWRVLYENAQLLEDPADRDVASASAMDRAVRRDLHKMHAFVRFREVARGGEEPSYVAWFEPQHEILPIGAQFFVKRFPNMRWTIATPDGAAVWDMQSLQFVDLSLVGERPRADGHEELWRTYYRSICNVARISERAMMREMPLYYWRNLPEAAEIAPLMREGGARFAAAHEEGDRDRFAAAKSVQRTLAGAGAGARAGDVQNCRACEIGKNATQAVEGAGPRTAKIMLVGEQPGDEEDLRGLPFVGPAGQVLDAALKAAGLSRSELYVTNAVKHFKWEPRGKRRLHKRPAISEIRACNGWLQQEIAQVKPAVIVALGASSLTALTGSSQSIDVARQMDITHSSGATILATYHPSAILRAEEKRGETLRALLTQALERAATLTRTLGTPSNM